MVTDGWDGDDGTYWVGALFVFVTPLFDIRMAGHDFFPAKNRGAESLRMQLSNCIDEHLPADTVIGMIVTDGASVERKAVDLLKSDNWWCVDHRFHNALHHAIEKSSIKAFYDGAIDLGHVIKSSGKLSLEMVSLQVDGHPKRMTTFSKTRWAGVYYFVKRFLELVPEITLMGQSGLCVFLFWSCSIRSI